jgi:glycine/D-amino acid oxidase-like deaminating enzyme
MRVHTLVVGQGIAGSLVAYQLLKRGKTVVVIDDPKPNTSSKVAAGLYNPITGQRMVKTWMADALFPFLEQFYGEMEQFLSTAFLHKRTIYRPFESISEQNEWFAKSVEAGYSPFVKAQGAHAQVQAYFKAPYGGLLTQISGFVDTLPLLESFSQYLKGREMLEEEVFAHEELKIGPSAIQYKKWDAEQIVFCEGIGALQNPLFRYLPLNGTKGELLDLDIEGYPVQEIVNKGVFVLPKNGRQSVGSNYEWNFENDQPSEKGKSEIEEKLKKILTAPYKILDHKAGVRPTVKDHRPLLGRHPEFPHVFIFNGMGTKGISLAPYFSSHFVQCLLDNRSFLPEADIRRFDYLYLPK